MADLGMDSLDGLNVDLLFALFWAEAASHLNLVFIGWIWTGFYFVFYLTYFLPTYYDYY